MYGNLWYPKFRLFVWSTLRKCSHKTWNRRVLLRKHRPKIDVKFWKHETPSEWLAVVCWTDDLPYGGKERKWNIDSRLKS